MKRMPSWVFITASILAYLIIMAIALNTSLLGHVSWDNDGDSDWAFVILMILSGAGISYAIMRRIKNKVARYVATGILAVILYWPATALSAVIVVGASMFFKFIF
jgi:membrane protein DedA with SNARE-associated domain